MFVIIGLRARKLTKRFPCPRLRGLDRGVEKKKKEKENGQ
jgi:hypothetical protein